MKITHLLILGALLHTIDVHAAALYDVRVDIGFSGLTPTFGGFWNTVDNPLATLAVVRNVDGSVVNGVAVSTSGGWSTIGGPNSPSWNGGQNKVWVDFNAATDYYFAELSADVMVSGLNPFDVFSVELLAARNSEPSFARLGYYSIFGKAADGTSSTAFNAKTQGFDQAIILKWTNVRPNALGQVILHTEDNGTYAYANAFRITVPEPSAIGMISASILWFLSRRRFSRALASALH